jgi:hypothetical protein
MTRAFHHTVARVKANIAKRTIDKMLDLITGAGTSTRDAIAPGTAGESQSIYLHIPVLIAVSRIFVSSSSITSEALKTQISAASSSRAGLGKG